MIRDELETPTTFANSKFVKSTNIDEKVTKQYFDCCLTKQEAVILFYELSQSAKLHFDFLILFFVEVKMSVANFDFQALTRLPPFCCAAVHCILLNPPPPPPPKKKKVSFHFSPEKTA